ncbi:MAG: hypothetical protein LDL12_05505 [Anaerolinea sp.]|nr:hypothetical protein [Anaerolinea sp.]
MAFKTWQVVKIRYCKNAGQEVSLEAEVIYPAEYLPDMPPQIRAHRCSRAVDCALFKRPTCAWAGTNPGYDPFGERDDSSSPSA